MRFKNPTQNPLFWNVLNKSDIHLGRKIIYDVEMKLMILLEKRFK